MVYFRESGTYAAFGALRHFEAWCCGMVIRRLSEGDHVASMLDFSSSTPQFSTANDHRGHVFVSAQKVKYYIHVHAYMGTYEGLVTRFEHFDQRESLATFQKMG